MADPQPTTSTQPHHAKSDTAPIGAASEPRSIEQARQDQAKTDAKPGDALAQTAQPMLDNTRHMAEQGRRAGQQVAEAWRGAVDPFLAMQYDLGRWFDDVWRQTFGFRQPPSAFRSPFTPAHFFGQPAADIRETDKAQLLAIELPGLTKDDVDISLDGDSLVICGHKAEESEDANASYRVSERRYGRFERVFPLTPDIDRAKIEAQFKDGLLKITLPKNPDAAAHRSRIEIQ